MLAGARRLCFGLYLVAIALLPFELPVAEGLHGTVYRLIGDGYMLFFCSTWILVLSLLHFCCRRGPLQPGWRLYSFYGLLYAVPGILAIFVSAVVSTGHVQLSIQQFFFGYMAPVFCCLALFAMTEDQQRQAWLAFYIGWCVFLAGSLIFLYLSWRNTDESFARLGIGEKLFLWRYTFAEPWNLYSVYLGNANKESNYILTFLLFSTVLLGRDRIIRPGLTRKIYFAYWILGTLTLVLLFSRAAILLLPLAVAAAGFWKFMSKRMRWTTTAAAAVVIISGFSSLRAALTYLFTTQAFNQPDVDVLGTFGQRFGQWSQIYSYLQTHSLAMFTGLGSGGYGDTFFGDFVRGTHNMFLDNLMESGIWGMSALILVLLLAFLHCFGFYKVTLQNRTAFIALLVLLMLMFREHSVSYLYITSLGGLCVTVIFYWLCSGIKEKNA